MKYLLVAALALCACSQGSEQTPPASEDRTAESSTQNLSVAMLRATPTGPEEAVGAVVIRGSASGAMFDLNLSGLPPGTHGFHIHQMASCEPSHENGATTPAGAAGGHFDPLNTGRHAGPEGDGHLGDLPRLEIGADGAPVQRSLTAPRITDINQLRGRALMIHEGGDNYADQPAPLGGGGARIACGVIG